nr:hypothetical protein [Tanacetum cinerariifolium]
MGDVRECLVGNKEKVIEKDSEVHQDQNSVIVEDNVQNQADRGVIDHSERVDSVEEVIGVCSDNNGSNDGEGIEKENEILSDEISNDKVIENENKSQGNAEVQNKSYADVIGDSSTDFENKLLGGIECVVNRGPWLVKNKPLIVQKWDINTVDSVEEVIGVCSDNNGSNDGEGIEKENKILSDEISNDTVPTEFDDNGIEVVVFDEIMVEEGSKRWEKTVCAYFVGYGVSANELKKWDINTCLDKTEPEVIPLWIKLCNVPLEAWTTKGLSALASRIGKPFKMDTTTTSMCKMGVGRFGFARVLVEVSAKKDLPYEIEVVYKNGAKEVICRKIVKVVYDWKPPSCTKCVFGHFSHQCGQNRGNNGRKESTKIVGEEQKNDMKSKPCANDKSDGEGFIAAKNKRNVGTNEKVLRPNFKPNTQQPKHQSKKIASHYEFQPKKSANNPTTIPEQVMNKETTPQEKSPSKSKEKIEAQKDKTPLKKAWNVHGENLSAMRRSANKYSVLDLYDETELVELQEVRNSDRVEG